MNPEMTGTQAEALAAFLVTLRPGQRSWTKAAVLDALREAASRTTDPEKLAHVAIRVALTPSVVTPQVIGMDGDHWPDKRIVSEPRRATRCDDCGGIHLPDSPHQPRITTTRSSEHIADLRAAHAAAKAHLCPCGVPPESCADHRKEPA